VLLAASRESAVHLWRAVRSLENCQRAARWALADPSLRVRHWLVGSAFVNGQAASLLRPHARRLDKTLERLSAAPVEEVAPAAVLTLTPIVPSIATEPVAVPGPQAS
jgi:hypothetical protein